MASVLQPWVQGLTLMQQSVLLGSIRGPDGIRKYSAAKYLVRWLRRCVLVSAFDGVVLTDPYDKRGGSFTGPSITVPDSELDRVNAVGWEVYMEVQVNEYFVEFDEYPNHFTKHFMMAAEILGYTHPDRRIRSWWLRLYFRLAKDMHLNPETETQMQHRLGDNRDNWLEGSEVATRK